VQKGWPFTKLLDQRVRFQANPLTEGSIAKTLQASAQLGTVRFNEPLAARSCGGNRASKACRIVHGFKNLP